MIARLVIKTPLAVAALATCALLASCGEGSDAGPPVVLPQESVTEAAPSALAEGRPLEQAAPVFFGPRLTVTDHGSFGVADRARVLPSPEFGALLRVRYPAGSASQKSSRVDGTPEGGAQLYLTLGGGPVDAALLAYHVRFPADFDFVKGGKLPGLYGGTRTGGGHIPDGTNGLSTRFMWRAAGAGEVYAYLPSSHVHGTSLGRGAWTFPKGRWVRLRQEVRLNTPGTADGSITVWLDDRQVLRQDGLVFRDTTDLKIDGLFFSTFFGGDDAGWSSPTEQHADFAGFTLTPADS